MKGFSVLYAGVHYIGVYSSMKIHGTILDKQLYIIINIEDITFYVNG